MHIPVQGVQPAPFEAPCPVFWLRDWEDAPVERLDGLHTGRWIAMVDDPLGWVAIVSRGLSVADVRLAICRGVHARTRRIPHHRTLHPHVHTRAWQRDQLARWAAATVEADGDPATLIWWPAMEDRPRRAEVLFPPNAGADAGIESKVQNAMDRKGPWAGPFDSEWPGLPLGGSWGHIHAIDQIGRGDGQPLPGGRERCSGKGRDAYEALVSAVCEAVERRCVTQPDYCPLPVKRDTGAAMASQGHVCIKPVDLVPFSDAQWAKPDRTVRAFFKMPERRMPGDGMDIEMDWVEGVDWHSGEPVLVPRDFCFYRPGIRDPWFVADTNGAAAGIDFQDAARRGFREILERAAIACWWIWKVRRPEVAISALPDDANGRWCRRAPAALATVGRSVHLLDVTLDRRLPCVVAIAMSKDGAPDPIYGMGCARTTSQAAVRALGEIVQCGMLTRPKAERLAYHGNAPEVVELAEAAPDAIPWMYPKGRTDPLEDAAEDGVEEAVAASLIGRAVVVDLSQRADEPSVVKVVCPSAPHFWHRLGSRNLYTLPVACGWMSREPRESEANALYVGV